jgi:Cu(I)-responsive transcriptional regulator
MLITQTAREAGVNTQTLRYYERRGLLPKPQRRGSGYREYTDNAVRLVRFIKRAQELGFSLEEVAALVRLRGVHRGERHRVRAIAERKIADIERKIAQLQSMRAALQRLVDSCRGSGAAECPIIEALNQEGRAPKVRSQKYEVRSTKSELGTPNQEPRTRNPEPRAPNPNPANAEGGVR